MHKRSWSARLLVVALVLLPPLGAQSVMQDVLIRSPKPYDKIVDNIKAQGGVVTHQYKYIDAVAAQVPVTRLSAVAASLPSGALSKDLVVAAPAPLGSGRLALGPSLDDASMTAESAAAISDPDLLQYASAAPNAYLINNALMNVAPLHAQGYNGLGMVVAVIDSGIRPGFPHISLDGSVIGGEDFVNDGLGYSNFANGGHGTFVAGMISANVTFTFGTSSTLRNAVLAECPACFINPPTNTAIPMIGTAPRSSIYALRVFGPTGGSPTSRILQAIDRVIELREKYNAADPAGLNITVVNLSLGGATVFAGGDLFDTAIDVLLAKDIVPVISAGNNGPSSLTVGSPGTSYSALTVGAASTPHNERILRRLSYGPVTGAKYRPYLGTQTAYFSARGPNANGQIDPDVVANGFACYGQGTGSSVGTISLGSGTSFSAPSVSGIAAVLRQKYPGATARQVRNAIIMSGDPALIHDGSTELDRGAGFVNAIAAADLLATGAAPDTVAVPRHPNSNVKVNIEQGTFLDVRDGLVTETFSNLKPGQRHEVLYRVKENTGNVSIVLSDVTPSLPPAQQNQLFGDDILLTIHNAKTSDVGDPGYEAFTFTSGGSWSVSDPNEGIMRITINGDWTNAGEISGKLKVSSTSDSSPRFSQQGNISSHQTISVPVKIAAGTQSLEVRLSWRETWASYPANDLDLILQAPNGALNYLGATLDNPEKATITNPAAGTWTVRISGFEVSTGSDKYELRILVDGKLVK